MLDTVGTISQNEAKMMLEICKVKVDLVKKTSIQSLFFGSSPRVYKINWCTVFKVGGGGHTSEKWSPYTFSMVFFKKVYFSS